VLKRKVDPALKPLYYFSIFAIAEMKSDGLFHIQDITRFLNLKPKEKQPNLDLTNLDGLNSQILNLNPQASPSINFTISSNPYTDREIKYGGAKVFVKSSKQYLTLLQWLHVRLGHTNENQIKKMVQHQSLLGTGVCWSDIKDLQLGPCDTCLKARMRAFTLPASISRRKYEVFEYLSCDYKPFHKVVNGIQKSISIRGYTGAIIYSDKASGKIFCYLVKSSSEWMDTLQQCIRDYGPGANPRL